MKKITKIVVAVILTPVLLFGLFLLYVSVTDFKPEPIQSIARAQGEIVNVEDTLNVFNWNLGYCGLGDDMSFFYDGGDRVRTSEERTIKNSDAIFALCKSIADTIDFFLFQEVDLHSKRSYYINQYDLMQGVLDQHHASFAYNYKVSFVPVPATDPLGKVEGGLASTSKLLSFAVDRHAFEGNYAWPKGLFLLDRCFMVQRYSTSNGKELLVINTHNSAYDDGTLRLRQMTMMKEFLFQEYRKGNYILVGGDWNQKPPSTEAVNHHGTRGHLTDLRIASDFMPAEWQWVSNDEVPTNRLINEVYKPGSTETSVIDFYLLSPNLKCVTSRNIDLSFEHSDHQPVFLKFHFIH